MPDPTTCPKCGAARTGTLMIAFECGSTSADAGDQFGDMKIVHGGFWKTDKCRIAELTRDLAAARAESDTAHELIRELEEAVYQIDEKLASRSRDLAEAVGLMKKCRYALKHAIDHSRYYGQKQTWKATEAEIYDFLARLDAGKEQE